MREEEFVPYYFNGRYEYKCTIDKDTSFSEIYEKCDIIGKEGDIYILRDKGGN